MSTTPDTTPDLATFVAEALDDRERRAILIGATLAYTRVIEAIGLALTDGSSLRELFDAVRDQYREVSVLADVEGLL